MTWMRVLITGGAGFIGSHLTDRLVADRGAEVVVLDNLKRGRLENLAACRERVQFVEGDIRDDALVTRLVKDTDVVYHLAAESTVMGAEQEPEYALTTNVLGTFNILRAAQAAGVKRVVVASSREVYGEPDILPVVESAPLKAANVYGLSKVAAEMCCRLLQARGLSVAILRLTNVYGLRDVGRVIPTFVQRALAGQPLLLYGGDQVLDFVWIGTVVECLIRAAHIEGLDGPINLGSGFGTPLVDLARRIAAAGGAGSPLRVLPPRLAEVRRFVADTQRMVDVLGVRPERESLSHLGELMDSRGPGRLRC
jgi:UDP-glucose 4-epimerase